ncbi:hypothetical protein [Rivularia sp. PCC 7116]|uniref:hypothetical protein n=1 Tax=Rivularia sp. PCC 7116 TaxID=373994 RepID=UPI0002E3C2E9|nr:hypothetical protein [Rivularia sp. PCC 7116]
MKLKHFLEKENKCLGGNRVARGSTLKGAAFMDNCQNVSGQLGKFKPAKVASGATGTTCPSESKSRSTASGSDLNTFIVFKNNS